MAPGGARKKGHGRTRSAAGSGRGGWHDVMDDLRRVMTTTNDSAMRGERAISAAVAADMCGGGARAEWACTVCACYMFRYVYFCPCLVVVVVGASDTFGFYVLFDVLKVLNY